MYIKFVRIHNRKTEFEELRNFLLQEKGQRFLHGILPRERKILSLRFGLKDGVKRTLRETAVHFGITRERVRQIQNLTIRKIREYIQEEGIIVDSVPGAILNSNLSLKLNLKMSPHKG